MKYFLLIGIFFIHQVSAQDNKLPVDETGKVSFSGVVNVDTSDKSIDLYKKSTNWYALNNYKITEKIPETFTMMAKCQGTIRVKDMIGKGNHPIDFKMMIECKDGKYKYTITEVLIEGWWDTDFLLKKDYKPARVGREALIAWIKDLTDSLYKSMSKKDNW